MFYSGMLNNMHSGIVRDGHQVSVKKLNIVESQISGYDYE